MMMDDDFGDFTGFSQAHGTPVQNDSSKGGSFPSKNGMMNSVSNDSNTQGTVGVTNFAQFDVNFDIPPPLSPPGTNIHVAGGVPFDIPPLDESFSFDDFTPDVESEHAFQFPGKSTPATTAKEASVGGSVSHQSAVQPVAEFGDFNTPITLTDVNNEHKTEVDTTSDQANAGWAADFNIPPPIDTAEDSGLEKTASETKTITSSSNGTANDLGWAADFGSFSIPPPIDSIEDSVNESALSETHKPNSDPTSNKAGSDMNEGSEFGAFEGVSAQTETKTVSVTDKADEGFGDFSASNTTEATSNVTSNISTEFANFSSFEPPPVPDTPASTPSAPPTDNFATFSSQFTSADTLTFPTFQSTSEQPPDLPTDEFGDFTSMTSHQSPSSNKAESSTSPNLATSTGKDSDFGDFTTTHSTDNFAALESTSTSEASKEGSSTGQSATSGFGAFDSKTEQAESFGDFSTAFGGTQTATSNTPTNDEFGDFSTGQNNFTAFGDANTKQTATSTTQPEDDFGDFNTGRNNPALSGDAPAPSGASTKDEFGDFSGGGGFSDFKTSSGDDDFGDFSGSNAGFGAFSTPGTPLSTTTTTTKDTKSVLMSSFPLVGSSAGKVITVSKFLTLLMGTKAQGSINQSVWQALQRCVDLTIPLYKWDKSNLQDDYYSAVKVDPMLISRPSTLSILTGHAKFEDPLGGTTAAEDLMESFGFEGELEESRKIDSTSPPPLLGRTPRKSEDRSTPTLLDLSLPETPGSPTGHNSFTLTEDLLGLDLNPQPQNQQLTSIQELLRNERLVVNKSNWVDSKLKEFGERGEATTSQPSTPQTVKRQNTVELQLQQLGLDANKVSSFTGGSRELSLAARTVLGRLPELTFMLETDKVVQTNQYSI